jgi:hypothetical protein
MEKVCNTCNIKKPLSDYRDNRKKCKKCENIKRYDENKLRRQTDPEFDKQWKQNDVKRKREKEKNDPLAAFKQMVRCRIRKALKRMDIKKNSKTHEMVGITWEEFKVHFENQFTDGMTWENRGEWHNEHIIPLSLALTIDELIELMHYTNQKPLWGKDNLIKGDKIYFHELTEEMMVRYEKFITRYKIKHNII